MGTAYIFIFFFLLGKSHIVEEKESKLEECRVADILRSNTSNISSFEHDIDVLPAACSQEIFSRPPQLKNALHETGKRRRRGWDLFKRS